mgnify:CR=1 FL=1
MHILRRMSKHLKAISLGSMALAAVGAIGWGVWHFRESRTMKTDDCRVEASIVSVGSKLAERVTSVDVEEGETVRRGQTLAHLDSRTMQARLMAARSRVKLMQASRLPPSGNRVPAGQDGPGLRQPGTCAA